MAKFREIIIKSIDLQSRTFTNIANEVKSIQALDIYLVPKEDGEHERYVVDNTGVISRHGVTGYFMPIEGLDQTGDRYITKFLTWSNYNYVQDSPPSNSYKQVIGEGGMRFQTGQPGNTEDNNLLYYNKYEFGVQGNYNYYGMYRVTPMIYQSMEGINMSVYNSPDSNNITRSSAITMRDGSFQMQASRTNNNTFQTDFNSLILYGNNTTVFGFYTPSTGQKTTTLSSEGIKSNAIPNVQGDETYNKQVVAQFDGTDYKLGIIDKDEAGSSDGLSSLYPKVDIIEFTSDNTNYYLKVGVSNMQSMGFADTPYFEVAVGKNGMNILANNISTTYQDPRTGLAKYSYTENPLMIGGFQFVITIPIASNTNPFWYDKGCIITATWQGNDNLDSRQQGGSPYDPRRLASDSKEIIDIQPKVQPIYPKVNIVEYSDDATHYLMKITVNNIDDSSYGNNELNIFNISTGGATSLIDAVSVEATFNGAIEYASTPAPGVGQYNRLWGFSFNVKFPKASNTSPFWSNENAAITVVYKGRDILDGGANSPYKPRRYDSDTKLIKHVKPNLKKIDNTIPNGVGDATYTRQLVQKTDGTIGWVARPLVLKGNQFMPTGGYTTDYNIAESFTNNNITHTGIGDTSNPITVRVNPGAPNYSETKGYWIFTVNQIVVTMEGACPTCYQQVVYKDGTGASLISGTKIFIAAGSAIFVVNGTMYIK